MLVASDYPLLNIIWTMLVFFAFVIWISILFRVFGDLFRRHDISGLGKAGWMLFVIVVPFLGVFIYLIAHGKEMAERSVKAAQAQQAQFDQYVRETAGGSAGEIAHAKKLLDSGAISQEEFERLKQKALA